MNSHESLRLSREPEMLFRETEALPPGSTVVIDEIQKVPMLLDEVHRLIEQRRLRFVLSGSSARKLRHGATNLLAGRALVEHMFPLTSAEMSFGYSTAKALSFGSLPLAVTGPDPVSYLAAYTETYLQEEVRAEALTRNIGTFSRFLEVAARQNGQVTNVLGISRDAAVSRQTVQNYFEILVDTMIGFWLRPWKLKRATKQISHPKFYLFDNGVARALSGRIAYPPSPEEQGALLETWLFHEIRSYLAYRHIRYPLYFWRSYNGVEVDLLCETRSGFVAVEMKASGRWDKRFNRGLNRIRKELGEHHVSCYGVYQGTGRSTWDATTVMPVQEFIQRLWSGEIIAG